MKIVIVGGGSVGKTVARDLLKSGHDITIIDLESLESQNNPVDGIKWIEGDACSPEIQKIAGVDKCDSLITATGDDKVNLVASIIAKSTFNVRKVVAKINHHKNKFLFNLNWGIDLAISMPDAMTDLIEDEILDDEMHPIYKINNTNMAIIKYRLGKEYLNSKITKNLFLEQNPDITVLTVVRNETVIDPGEDFLLEYKDILLFLKDTSN